MGKNTKHDDDDDHEQAEGGAAGAGDRLTLGGNHGPSCMWGILHHFQHNRWLHAKKLRLTTPKHHHHLDQGRSTKTGSHDSAHSTVAVETKSSSSKNSMKSRLKSLITEEIMSKRKGGGGGRRRHHHHQRSTSYPTRDPPDDATTPPTPTPEFFDDITTNAPSPCEMCTTMLDLNYGRDFVQESKLFMNALDLLNLRKEVFLKILQDPNSSLAHHLPRSNPNAFTKSVSFPASSSSSSSAAITDFDNNSNNNKHAVVAEELELEVPDNNDNKNNKRHSDKNNSKIIVLKRFKNLREKIKHVIRDKKKEKNRIIMDAVHHKIPYGEGHHNNNNKARDYGKFGGKQKRHHKRTSSFDESYSRYNRLLDTISSDVDTTAKHLPAEAAAAPPTGTSTSTSTTPVFKRILSLPDLRAYSSIHTDDNYNNCNTDGINDVVSAATDDNNNNIVDDQPRAAYGMSASLDNLFDVGSTFDDSIDSKTWETASSNDLNPPNPMDQDDDDDHNDNDHEIQNMATDQQHIADTIDALEIEKLYSDLLQLHVGSKNEAEFNYVKDVLELSGFTRDELLGAWHSAERPVDPSVFDEVEGSAAAPAATSSLFSNPEEGGPYDQLLLFDLINEVLLDIHERSFCYWPVPLTVRSRIHQMPKGYRVLEEVWAEISWLLSWRLEVDQSIDDAVGRDLAKHDRWMSLQMDAEFVGLEIEDMIFDDLLDDIVSI